MKSLTKNQVLARMRAGDLPTRAGGFTNTSVFGDGARAPSAVMTKLQRERKIDYPQGTSISCTWTLVEAAKPKQKTLNGLELTAKAWSAYWEIWDKYHAASPLDDAMLDKVCRAEDDFKLAFAKDSADVNSPEKAALVGTGSYVTMLLAKYGPDWVQPEVRQRIEFLRKSGSYEYNVEARFEVYVGQFPGGAHFYVSDDNETRDWPETKFDTFDAAFAEALKRAPRESIIVKDAKIKLKKIGD
jgi:hypothetical protein